VDFAVTLPIVDPAKIALSGWSLGGYLAPRGASGEPRIAAVIADPGTWSIAGGFRDFAIHKLGASPEATADLGTIDDELLGRLDATIQQNRALHWKVVQRGFWVHGVDNLRDYLRSAELFSMQGRAELIRCPTLITTTERDPLAAAAPSFFEALRCPKTLLRFSASEGAGGHCEMMGRSIINRRVLDWLDEQFGQRSGGAGR
jgi:pimeloyl-ACP methyl ester carboxylesterase